ncbi:proteolipid protein 2-like [Lithobates pipiens]
MMSDVDGAPEQHQPDNDCMALITAYLQTNKGKILAAETVLCLVITVCHAASWTPGYMGFSLSEFIYCLILFLIFATKYDLEFPYVHWGWTDFFRAAIGCGLFFIFSLISLTWRFIDNSGIAAAVFGLFTSVLFGYDSYLTFPKLRKPKAQAAVNGPGEPKMHPHQLP